MAIDPGIRRMTDVLTDHIIILFPSYILEFGCIVCYLYGISFSIHLMYLFTTQMYCSFREALIKGGLGDNPPPHIATRFYGGWTAFDTSPSVCQSGSN